MQARCCEHSELTRHSGRQDGGVPWYPGLQEQTARSFMTRQILYGPHGDGVHGFCGRNGAAN